MSGICGIFHLDRKPVDPAFIRAMMGTMVNLGPDGEGVWWDGPVGLGHRLYHNTPEALHERQPLQSADGSRVLTAAARIDNRSDLFRLLSIPSADHANIPDGALVLKAYEKWGEDCPQYLLGDWSFAVWDAREQKLFLARDHHGQTELVYSHSPKRFAFGSTNKSLLSLPDASHKFNERRLGQLLDFQGWAGEERLYEGFLSLCAGRALTVTPRGLHVRRYWFPENTPELRLASDRDYEEAFLDVYTEAVRCRLRSLRPVGATLSGGLDSSSVSSLAARALGERGKRLPAFTFVPVYNSGHSPEPGHFNNESPYTEAISRYTSNIDVQYITAEDISPLAAIYRLLDHFEESSINGNAPWFVSLLDTVTRQNIGTLLIGHGGNLTTS